MSPNARQTADGAIAILAGGLIFVWLWQRHLLTRTAIHPKNLALLLIAALVVTLLAIVVRFMHARRGRLRPAAWDKMSGAAFEDQVVIWLKLCGYNQVAKTEYYDQGIDILAAKPGLVLGVQVKRSSRPIGVAAVRAAVAGLKSYGCNQAMVVTNSRFTPAATRLAAANDCRLVDGNRLRRSLADVKI